ncbi:MAG TPA: FAD-dependent oxidoreductase [Gemmatimonadales bacterium]|nr:FAD-dependent oxidoreductase [Gemmatimonadales bacterium]
MNRFKYLIIGGGMTGDAAAHGIRELDATGSILLVSGESHPPYNRPPLSKGLWKGESEEKVWRPLPNGVDLLLERRIVSLDAKQKQATDDKATTYGFEKLLLATGGTPRRLPGASATDRVIYYRTYDDYRRLRDRVARPVRVAVIGGGFIGSEVAAAVRMQDRDVVMIVPEQGLGARVFPADLSAFLVDYYKKKGVETRIGEGVSGLENRGSQFSIKTTTGKEVVADLAVAGLGIVPNTDLAQQVGAKIDNGIVVDEHLRTTVTDIYAAGDAANFYNPALDMRLRVEHEDNANTMGQAAGRAMAGSQQPYDHLPFFYSDLFELGYEAVGELDSRLQTFADWKERFREGVVYYLKDGRVRGVLLWNTWGQVDAARALIAEKGPFTANDLKGRLPA